jgi:hypothetical protein
MANQDLLASPTNAPPPAAPAGSSPPAQGAEKSRWPTHKWWAALFTATGAWVANFINVGTFNKAIAIALVGLISQQLVAYVTPNYEGIDGIGGVKPRKIKPKSPAG